MRPVSLLPLRPPQAFGWILATWGSFHAGYLLPGGWSMVAFPFALFALVRLPTPRLAFYVGLGVGLGLYAPHLGFFWTLFGPAAGVLWLILAFWIATFLGIGQALSHRLPPSALTVALPLLWTGLEYFRGELYFLRFSWLTPALAFVTPPSPSPFPHAFRTLGTYGIGCLLALSAAWTWFAPGPLRRWGPAWLGILLAFAVVPRAFPPSPAPVGRTVGFAGAQIESVAEDQLGRVLDELIAAHPESPLILLPEYSLAGEPDTTLRDWCRTHRRHVIVGGRESLSDKRFFNTAFVVDPLGNVVFRQAKSVPIQFFDDGLPAPSQQIWHSPWGRIGIAICYDLSYTRVIDRLVRQGAEALVVPTMDAVSWGSYQHALHGRIAPTRAAEYGLPIVRVASSGISQSVLPTGRVTDSAPFSESVEFFAGHLEFRGDGSLPVDRWLAPTASVVAALLTVLTLLPARSIRGLLPPASPSPSP